MLQFRVSQLFGIVTKIHGMALASEEGIRLAFHQPEDAKNKRLLDVEVRDVVIAWDNLASIKFDKGLLSDSVIIQVKSQEPLSALPGITKNEVTLETRRHDREAFKKFEHSVAEYQAGRRQDNVDEMLDDIQDFLHGS